MTRQHHFARPLQEGLTLLELVIALALSALVALLGSAAMSNAVDFYHRGSERALMRENLRTAERMLRHEWASRGNWLAASATAVEFDAVWPVATTLPEPESVARVRYICAKADDATGWILRHEILPRQRNTPSQGQPEAPTVHPLESTVIASRLHTCQFSVLVLEPTSQGRPKPRWISDWLPTAQPPDLLRVAMSPRPDMPAVVFQSRGRSRP